MTHDVTSSLQIDALRRVYLITSSARAQTDANDPHQTLDTTRKSAGLSPSRIRPVKTPA
jgi:hypothetical protein